MTNTRYLSRVMRQQLGRPDSPYFPLALRVVDFKENGGDGPEAAVELTYGGRAHRFAVMVLGRSAPGLVQRAAARLQEASLAEGYEPMLLLPYVSESAVNVLQSTPVSAIDPNGNYFIQLPSFLAVRLDRKNRYPESREIKRIYSGNSSTVGRYLLRENRTFERVTEIHEGIRALGGGISLSTVSKVLRGLEEDLIIRRSAGTIRLLQAPELLAKLREQYVPPRTIQTLRLKLPDSRAEKESLLDKFLGENLWMWSGETSIEAYTPTTPSAVPVAYTRTEAGGFDALRDYEDMRFYNCEVGLTDSGSVFFDRQGRWASQLECYLALSRLDKREREIALSIEPEILRPFE